MKSSFEQVGDSFKKAVINEADNSEIIDSEPSSKENTENQAREKPILLMASLFKLQLLFEWFKIRQRF
ncbi:hypothetical protein CHN56_03669 [Bacillus velezensis]|nr:hypothetical protein CHN56_03669 [Bacillus velezensis]ATC50038.1 hypothetical protein CLI97_00702 [Bacillus velezensis]MBA5711618.1 hypothetical protein [Bacillus velezensis]